LTATPKAAVRRISAARLISITGSAAAYVGLTFAIYRRTGSPAWVAATLLLTFGTAGFVGPVAGTLGDRFDRRRVMIVSDLAGAACFAAMAFASSPVLLLGIAFLSAVAEAPFVSASGAAIPNLVEAGDVSWANSLVQMGRFAGISVGPALGGALLSRLGEPGGIFALNSASFVLSAVLVSTVHGRFNDASSASEGERGDALGSGVRAGLRFLLREPVLRRITAAWVVLTLGLGMSMVADAPLAVSFHAGPIGFALIVTAWGVGSVAGSFAGRFLSARTEPHAIVWGTLLIAVAGGGMALSPVFWPIVAFGLVMGVGDSVGMIADQGVRQRRTPDAIRSRVMAASDAAWQLALGVAFLLAGPVLAVVGPQGTYAVGGIAAALTTLILLPILRSAATTDVAPLEGESRAEAASAGPTG
jgi:MFS family permease